MLAFEHATVIDGTGAAPVRNVTVIIKDKKISAVGVGIPIPSCACVLDLKGRFLLPGFSDVHTHLGGSARFDRPPHTGRFVSYDYAEHREAALCWGVTTVRSAGDFMPDILEIREAANSGAIRSPRIVTAGRMIQARNGHPGYTVLFQDPAVMEHELVFVDEDSNLEDVVKQLSDQGVDWIKLVISENNVMDFPNKVPRLSNVQLRRLTEAAHKYGKPVMAHVDDISGMKDAALCGVDTIEHTLNAAVPTAHTMTDEVLKLLLDRKIWVVPTMVATKYHDGNVKAAPLSFPDLKSAVHSMIESGVRLGVGCDSGIPLVPYGLCLHEEMELLCQAGMSPLSAISAATGGNAKLLGKEREFGTVTIGQDADLVILERNPLENIQNTRSISMVLRSGEIVVDRFLSRGQ